MNAAVKIAGSFAATPIEVSMAGAARLAPAPPQSHFDAFKEMADRVRIADPFAKLVPRSWASVTGLGEALPSTRQNRASLLALAADGAVWIAVVCWSILAWGGMHGRHRAGLHKQADRRWLTLADVIRNGLHSRSSAYDGFAALRRQHQLAGMGPANFTKLIFFLMPRQPGRPIDYIMDRWVACSINLLAGRDVVLTDANLYWAMVRGKRRLQSGFIVSDLNDGAAYEDYCTQIEEIAACIGQPPHVAEWLMMSEGRGLGDWRNHVIRHRKPPHE